MSSSKIRCAVFDIDGTLLGRYQDKIEDSAVKAIHKLKAQGIQVLVATGRSFYFIKSHVKEVLDCDYYVSINGSCVLNHDGQVIIRHDIPTQDVEIVLDLADRYNIAMALKTSKEMVVLRDYPGFTAHYGIGFDVHRLMIDDTQKRDYFKTVEPAMGLFLIGDTTQILPALKALPQFRVEGVGSSSLDVFNSHIDKTKGIDEVLKTIGVTWDEVIAFGDGDNDLEMIEKAGIGVAMGNATEKVKQKADYITLDVDQGGIASALEFYSLIDSF